METSRGRANVKIRVEDGDPRKVLSVEISRRGSEFVRESDVRLVAQDFASVQDEFREWLRAVAVSMEMVERPISEINLDDELVSLAKQLGISSVPTGSGPHPLAVHKDIRAKRYGDRQRLPHTDELFEDVAFVVKKFPGDWVDQLVRRYGWTPEHARKMKGKAVKRGLLPAVSDGRGLAARKKRGKK